MVARVLVGMRHALADLVQADSVDRARAVDLVAQEARVGPVDPEGAPAPVADRAGSVALLADRSVVAVVIRTSSSRST